MRPRNWNRQNFTEMRFASATTCKVWTHPDQEKGKDYHSWEDDLYKLERPGKPPLYLVSQPRGFKRLKEMLENFLNPMHPSFKPDGFVRAEIYENFTGQVLYERTMTEIKDAANDSTLFKLNFRTDDTLKQPGKHRILDTIESTQAGVIHIDQQLMKDHLNAAWKYWFAHSRFAPMKLYKAAAVMLEYDLERQLR